MYDSQGKKIEPSEFIKLIQLIESCKKHISKASIDPDNRKSVQEIFYSFCKNTSLTERDYIALKFMVDQQKQRSIKSLLSSSHVIQLLLLICHVQSLMTITMRLLCVQLSSVHLGRWASAMGLGGITIPVRNFSVSYSAIKYAVRITKKRLH